MRSNSKERGRGPSRSRQASRVNASRSWKINLYSLRVANNIVVAKSFNMVLYYFQDTEVFEKSAFESI